SLFSYYHHPTHPHTPSPPRRSSDLPNIPATEYSSTSQARAIASAAQELNALRESWLNPPALIRRVRECGADFSDRVLPVNDRARSEEHTSELQSLAYLVCRLLLEKK